MTITISKLPNAKISDLPHEVIDSPEFVVPHTYTKRNASMREIVDQIKLQVKEELDEEGRESTQETLQEALQLLYQISLADRLPDTLQQELESFLWRHYDRE